MTTTNQYPSRIEESRMLVAYFAEKVHGLVAAKRSCDAAGIVNSAWHGSSVSMWFCEWRKERRRLAALLQVNHS